MEFSVREALIPRRHGPIIPNFLVFFFSSESFDILHGKMNTTSPQPSEGKLSFPPISSLHNLWIERINKVMDIFFLARKHIW
jgi:hypothetical protein